MELQTKMTLSESQNIEWKESWICGFANAQGGTLIIGKNDKGVTVGIPNAKHLLETLPNKVRDLLGIIVDVNLLKEAGKELIESDTPNTHTGTMSTEVDGLLSNF